MSHTTQLSIGENLPYRPNVGAMIFNPQGRIFIARRADIKPHNQAVSHAPKGVPVETEIWQCPQGGIDAGEKAQDAVIREVFEEIGTRQVRILGEHTEWISYDLPTHLIGVALKGQYRGQRQKWFALLYTGDGSDIRLDTQPYQEFDAWRWIDLPSLPHQKVGFKKPVYERLVHDFAHYVHDAQTYHTRIKP
ncbi:MAG: RNA pyrophosphohydrolase [Acetobacter sp.]|nr:RNA pyrophosphohydrolase [Acetobacter sp.]